MSNKLLLSMLAGMSAIGFVAIGLAILSTSPGGYQLPAESLASMPPVASPDAESATMHSSPSPRHSLRQQAALSCGAGKAISQTDSSVQADVEPYVPFAPLVSPVEQEQSLLWDEPIRQSTINIALSETPKAKPYDMPRRIHGWRRQHSDISGATNKQPSNSGQVTASDSGSISSGGAAEVVERHTQTELNSLLTSDTPVTDVSADSALETSTSPEETVSPAASDQEPVASSTPDFFALSEFDFIIYDAISHRDGFGELESPWKDLKIFYAGSLWRTGGRSHVDTVAVAKRAAAMEKPALICLDVEHWLGDAKTYEEVESAIDKHILMIRTFRESAPEGTMIGFYSMLPHRDYWSPVSGDSSKIEAWQRRNRQLDRLAEEVDVIFPSLYSFYDDLDNWRVYAEANIAEAKRYGKPIVPFLWPRYHNSNPVLGNEFIPEDQWTEMLKTVYEHTPRVVIWDGMGNHDADEAWWKATQQFIEAKKSRAFATYD